MVAGSNTASRVLRWRAQSSPARTPLAELARLLAGPLRLDDEVDVLVEVGANRLGHLRRQSGRIEHEVAELVGLGGGDLVALGEGFEDIHHDEGDEHRVDDRDDGVGQADRLGILCRIWTSTRRWKMYSRQARARSRHRSPQPDHPGGVGIQKINEQRFLLRTNPQCHRFALTGSGAATGKFFRLFKIICGF
jgi:hypothetical protein